MPHEPKVPTEEEAIELQHKLEQFAARQRAAIDVVVTLLVAQFPALLSANETITTVVSWLN